LTSFVPLSERSTKILFISLIADPYTVCLS
jgi:hypothetical protein